MDQVFLFFQSSKYSDKFFKTYRSYLQLNNSTCADISNFRSLLSLARKLQNKKNIISIILAFILHLFFLLFLSVKWSLTGGLRSVSPSNSYELDYYSVLDDEFISIVSHLSAKNKIINKYYVIYCAFFAFSRCILLLSLARVIALYPYKYVCCTNERVYIKNALISTLNYYSPGSVSIIEFCLGVCQINRMRSIPCAIQKENQNYQPPHYSSAVNSMFSTRHKNVVFLHVFGDSSCHIFSDNRIRRNYYQWIESIKHHIEISNEEWIVRFHPHASSWGEDSITVLNHWFPEFFKLGNICIDFASERICLDKGDRVITFNGTVAEEMALQGIRAITYELTSIEQYSPGSTVLLNSRSLESYYLSDDIDRNLLILDTSFTANLAPTSQLLKFPPPPSLVSEIKNCWAYYTDDSIFSFDELRYHYPFLIGL